MKKITRQTWRTKRSSSPVSARTPLLNQVMSFTDIISEGPIAGLVNAANSIYLDNSPVATKKQAGVNLSSTAVLFNTTANSTSVSVSNLQEDLTPWSASDAGAGNKYLILHGFGSIDAISAVANDSDDPPSFTVTTPSAFFEDYMVSPVIPPGGDDSNWPYIMLLGDGSHTSYGIKGRILSISNSTTAKVIADHDKPSDWLDTSGSTNRYNLKLFAPFKIASISASSLVLDSDTNLVTGSWAGAIGNATFDWTHTAQKTVSDTAQVDGLGYQFRVGKLDDKPINDVYSGSGSTSITRSINQSLDYPESGDVWPVTAGTDYEYTKTSSDMGLSSSTARQVDMIRMVFHYPAGLISKGVEKTYEGVAAYLIKIAIDKGDGFGDFTNINPSGDFTYHIAASDSPFFLQEDIPLEIYKPFKDFKIKIARGTRDDLGPKLDFSYDQNNSVVLNSTWTTTTCLLQEKLNHPYTALAQISCAAKQYNSVPKRSYECKGKLIQVPTNYVTRDESATGIANYKRNPTSGAITATEQDWDGAFSGQVYTDNPAWVFYDILTNNRYGLGTWINASDIDKYALYRIARYCDELVPDGKGGTEPRFRANIYLTKATAAYKVLKDMATTFRAILFWSEGNILPVIDQDKDPIYNFTKGNVIDGAFKYEGTGSKLRSNQVAVTWNNPENDYVAEALLVEDRENIVKTGKIITEEAVAFGATSIGQATRYGRWKLWTAINQQEVVSFKAAISGAFIGPGDIINIQDADRYDVSYSGRISNTGTFNTTTIPLDRTIVLDSGSTYELSVLIQEPAAFLAQDTATLSTGALTLGDVIPSSLYTDEESASNIQDTSNNIVQITWAPHTHVVSKPVTNSGSVTSITVSGGFTAFSTTAEQLAHREAIWLLKETVNASGLEREGSKKMYKILGITESKKTEFSITAVEHFNEKFDAVDEDFGRPYVDTILEPSLTVPAPSNIQVEIS